MIHRLWQWLVLQVHTQHMLLQVIPRSVLFAQFEGVPYLLCALGDGHLFTFHINRQTGTLLLFLC